MKTEIIESTAPPQQPHNQGTILLGHPVLLAKNTKLKYYDHKNLCYHNYNSFKCECLKHCISQCLPKGKHYGNHESEVKELGAHRGTMHFSILSCMGVGLTFLVMLRVSLINHDLAFFP